MKSCKQCGISKEDASFAKNGKLGRHPRCKDCMSSNARLTRLALPDHHKKLDKANYERNKISKNKSSAEYYQANKDSIKQKEHIRYVIKCEHIKLLAKTYRINNRDKVYSWNGTRRAKLRNKAPTWGNKFIIDEIYALARLRTKITGIDWQVDHVIPLNHHLVSGLHVETNLQVITKVQNLTKSNKWSVYEINH